MEAGLPTTSLTSPLIAVPAERPTQRRGDILILGMSLAVIALAAVMQTVDSEHVAFSFMPNFVLPHVCMSRALLHVDCPGCGLTRSFIAMAHGDFAAAWHFNRVGVLLALFTAAQVPYRIYCLSGGRKVPGRYTGWAAWTLLAIFIGNWVLHLAGV